MCVQYRAKVNQVLLSLVVMHRISSFSTYARATLSRDTYLSGRTRRDVTSRFALHYDLHLSGACARLWISFLCQPFCQDNKSHQFEDTESPFSTQHSPNFINGLDNRRYSTLVCKC